jgi:hypothetical protein
VHALCTTRSPLTQNFFRFVHPASKMLTPRALPAPIQVFLDSPSLAKSADLLFLNCTKNTELTSRQFPRRVSFALTKIKRQFPTPKNKSGDGDNANRPPPDGHLYLEIEY